MASAESSSVRAVLAVQVRWQFWRLLAAGSERVLMVARHQAHRVAALVVEVGEHWWGVAGVDGADAPRRCK
ncbi:MAG: hypothetical protein IPG34_16605 [Rhodocyclaceae bacterium]|nr:hypothetical protein [Rhodocyclaceae bacterium]